MWKIGILWLAMLVSPPPGGDDPPEYLLRDQVDITEVNQVFEPGGKCAFRQYLFYDWDAPSQGLRIRAWRPLHVQQIPLAVDPRTGQSVLVFFDGGALRVIRAADHWHTDTTEDAERQEKRFWPARDRLGLRPLPK